MSLDCKIFLQQYGGALSALGDQLHIKSSGKHEVWIEKLLGMLKALSEADALEEQYALIQKIHSILSATITQTNSKSSSSITQNFFVYLVEGAGLSESHQSVLLKFPHELEDAHLDVQNEKKFLRLKTHLENVCKMEPFQSNVSFDFRFFQQTFALLTESRRIKILDILKENIVRSHPKTLKFLIDANYLNFQAVVDVVKKEIEAAHQIQDLEKKEEKLKIIFKFLQSFPKQEKQSQIFSDLYKRFLDSDLMMECAEIDRRKELSQIFPLVEGKDKQFTMAGITFDRDGAVYSQMLTLLKEDLDVFLKETPAILEKTLRADSSLLSADSPVKIQKDSENITAEVMNIFRDQASSSHDPRKRLIPFRTYRSEESGATKSTTHAEGLLIYGHRVFAINRGARDKKQQSKAGIVVFEGDPSTIPEDTLEKLKQSLFRSDSKSDILEVGLALQTDLETSGLKRIDHLEMKSQKVGNCSWASSKGLVLAVFYAVIREHLFQKMDESQKTDVEALKRLDQRSQEIARKCYKEFTKFSRLRRAKAYIAYHQKKNFMHVDQVLVKRMHEKILAYQSYAIAQNIDHTDCDECLKIFSAHERLAAIVGVPFVPGLKIDSFDPSVTAKPVAAPQRHIEPFMPQFRASVTHTPSPTPVGIAEQRKLVNQKPQEQRSVATATVAVLDSEWDTIVFKAQKLSAELNLNVQRPADKQQQRIEFFSKDDTAKKNEIMNVSLIPLANSVSDENTIQIESKGQPHASAQQLVALWKVTGKSPCLIEEVKDLDMAEALLQAFQQPPPAEIIFAERLLSQLKMEAHSKGLQHYPLLTGANSVQVWLDAQKQHLSNRS